MDEALSGLIVPDKAEDEKPLTLAQIEAERGKWHLTRPEHLDLFVLYRSMGGGGESLYDLWKLTQEPGSAALLHDFAILGQRLKRLKARDKDRKDKAKGGGKGHD